MEKFYRKVVLRLDSKTKDPISHVNELGNYNLSLSEIVLRLFRLKTLLRNIKSVLIFKNSKKWFYLGRNYIIVKKW